MRGAGAMSGRTRGRLMGASAMALALVVAMAWAVASAPGSSADDDYHLASIWCAWAPEDAGCVIVNHPAPPDPDLVSVPDLAIQSSYCAAFHSETSGLCPYLSPDGTVAVPDPDTYQMRSNNGSYPDGFYDVMRLFVVDSAATSVVLMRMASALVCLALLVSAGLVSGWADRWRLWLYWLVGAVPMGLFVFASNNPSGVAVAGAAAVFPATLAALAQAPRGRRAWPAAALAAVAALLAVSSRNDAVYFCGLAVACAVVVNLTTRRHDLVRQVMVLAPVGAVLAVTYVTGAVGGLAGGAPASGRVAPTGKNIQDVLSFYVGGFATTLGWLDVPMPSLAWGSIALALGAAFGYGVGGLGRRRALAFGVTLGLALFLPVYMLENVGYGVGEWVQPRYLLPIVVIILGILALHGSDRGVRPTTSQLLWIAGLATVGHSVALHVLMRRYITGLDVGGFNLNEGLEWWWSVPVKPMTTWVVGSVAFAVLSVVLAVQAGVRSHPQPEPTAPQQEDATATIPATADAPS